MGRARSPNVEEAYKQYKKGAKLVDIARNLDVPDSTVRRWKKTYEWDNKRSKKITNANSSKKITKKSIVKKEIEELNENSSLTEKQKLFCIHYVKKFNATKAYQKAYGAKTTTAAVEGCKLLKNPNVIEEINKLKNNKLNRAMLDADDIFQKYIDIAFSDITEYVSFGQEKIGKSKINVVNIKDSEEVDGSLISEISQGKSGVKIKLYDKMKALEWLADRMELLPVETQIRLENEKQKLELSKERLEHDKDIDNKKYF